MLTESYVSHSSTETISLGYELGKRLPSQAVICFFGDLAAGKTTFIKGVVAGAAQIEPTEVHSPTFNYLNIFEGEKRVYHFDLYRLRDLDEFLSMGFDEYLEAEGICCIEWSERIEAYLPKDCMRVHMMHEKEGTRIITIRTLEFTNKSYN